MGLVNAPRDIVKTRIFNSRFHFFLFLLAAIDQARADKATIADKDSIADSAPYRHKGEEPRKAVDLACPMITLVRGFAMFEFTVRQYPEAFVERRRYL